MAASDLSALKAKLEAALLRHDRLNCERAARSRRAYYNPNAYALYLGRLDRVMAAVAAGAPLDRALATGFHDRVLTVLQRAAGLPAAPASGACCPDCGFPDGWHAMTCRSDSQED